MRKSNRLPNFHNLGVALRILLITNAMVVLAVMVLNASFAEFLSQLTSISAIVQPMLLLNMLVLYTGYPLLKKITILARHHCNFYHRFMH